MKPRVNAPLEHQPDLLEILPEFRFMTAASKRTHFGKAIEEVACAAFRLIPIPINSNCEVNFDARLGDMFYEFKSAADAGSPASVIYDSRIRKDRSAGVPLTYVFGLHQAKGAATNRELWEALAGNGVRLLSVPARIVHKLALEQPLQKVARVKLDGSPSYAGYAREGYRDGYRRLPLKPLLEAAEERELERTPVKKYGMTIPVTNLTHP